MVYFYIALYLISIFVANTALVIFGNNPIFLTFTPSMISAFFLIPINLTVRDSLHDKWGQKNLVRNMFLLILSGSVLSTLFNLNALPIAVASFFAFLAAGLTDTLVYSRLFEKSQLVRMNGSNLASSFVDTFVFLNIAFGFTPFNIILLEWLIKFSGGVLWSLILTRRYPRYAL
jgi:uncharacterized PurR-regulated membrane protein YhhQ (DUF165 family)